METDKILIHYAQFVADMFCNFTGHKNIVSEVVVNDTVNVIFHNSPRWREFECDIKFNSELTPEEQILLAFDVR